MRSTGLNLRNKSVIMSKKEYAVRNIEWLKAKAAEPGVIPLGGGVFCRIMASGSADAPQPNLGSVVVVNYTGRTIDGRVFGTYTSPGGSCRSITGWRPSVMSMSSELLSSGLL